MSKFKDISFPSSYISRRRRGGASPCDRPDCQHDGGQLLYEFVVKNRFRKIIDFGTWSGGSLICEAQALQELAHQSNMKKNSSPFNRELSEIISDARNEIDKGWSLHRDDDNSLFYGEISIYDKSWGGVSQEGNLADAITHIKEYECYDNVQFNFKKMDIWEWIKNPESFDFLHVDISNTPEKILKVVDGLREQINEGGVVIFNGGSLRYHHANFGQNINSDGVDISGQMVTFGTPENYARLKATGLDFILLTQEFPGFICIDRRSYMKRPDYLCNNV